MIWLVDGNILVAYAVDTHFQHQQAVRWFDGLTESFATCSVTQGTLLRLHMKFAADQSAKAAWNSLKGFEAHPAHVYWLDDLPYSKVPYRSIQGHRQVTDAWLVELARRNGGKVATLDQGMTVTYPDTAVLI
ncbi:PIN domain-containing protein [Prosthecobacter sp.]|uniref:PIN domain-containing protein n=1 Tax=Prosthecobacter sp. TaxID=1965333 RepID=UPI0024886C45|nr:PIN domain-containing protein [Prosthecobacter sp.]MDI1311525.1 VapC toxin family PIN domain ribonuclease [Prosthecobacter sp.]